MRVIICFWKLETENNLLHVFSFLHNLSFENSFCFLFILGCQTSFLVSKIENCFWKLKINGKSNYQTYPQYSNLSLKKTQFSFQLTCHVRLHSLLSQSSTNYILEKKITINKLKKIILLKKIMLTKYDKHTNQEVHCWNLVRAFLLGFAKLCHFNTSKNLLYYFTTHHSSYVLFFDSKN